MTDNFKKKAASSIFWTVSEKVVTLGIQFISGIILARLLTPEDYGCIGMLLIFTSVSQTFIDGGLGSALIQKKEPTLTDYSTVFYWNLAVSLLMYFVLFISAPYIAEFYRMPILSSVLRVQSLVLIISALSVVQINQLQKSLKFKKIALITLITSIISLIVTIVLAYKGFGVWALVAQYLCMAAIPTFIYWITNKWYPRLEFSTNSFKELFGFGIYMLFTKLINNISRSLEGLLIGRFYSAATMGLYTKGKSLEGFAMTGFSEALNKVTYPLYAQYQDNKYELVNLIKKMSLSVAVIMFPFACILILAAKPLFLLLYSERWLGSVPYFQILCLSGIAVSMQGVNSLAIAAIGMSKRLMNYTLAKRIISIILLLIGLYFWGMKGLLLAVVLESWVSYSINAYLVSKYIGYHIKEQIFNLMPIALMSTICFCIAYLAYNSMCLNLYVTSLLSVILFSLTYIILGIVFKLESFRYVLKIFHMLLKKTNI